MNSSKKKFKKFPITKLTITAKRHKWLVINLTKERSKLYTENYKTLLRDIKEELNKGKDIPYSWLGGLNIVKVAIMPKLICRLKEISIKIPTDFFLLL